MTLAKRLPVYGLVAALIVAVHFDKTGTHLIPVLLGMALIMGAVLLVAAAELGNAQWIKRIKRPLLATAPLLFIFPALVTFAPYQWLDKPNAWLNQEFFLLRNVACLLILAIIGNIYRRLTLAESAWSKRWAVIYILSFVTVKTLVAIDWVMSFDYPWISTMFPVLYMIEALYAGIALASVICFVLERRQAGSSGNTLYDSSSLFFGFALFWGGLFFAQYLTIWYGNIPEEVYYFTRRFHTPGGPAYFIAGIALLFAIPFTTLMNHKARFHAGVGFALAHIVLIGLVIHRGFHILPHVELNIGWLLAQSACMLGALAWAVRGTLEEA